MKITAMKLSSATDTIDLNLKTAESTEPYLIAGATGLDADDIAQRFYAQAQNPVDLQYRALYDMVLAKREISILMIPNPVLNINQTYSELRDKVYKMISSSRFGDITLSFYEGALQKALVKGAVTKVETAHFTDSPQIQVTMLCKDPILRAPPVGRQYIFSGDLNARNNVLDTTDELSTAPHGMLFAVQFDSFTTEFTIGNNAEGWRFQILNPSPGFFAGDVLRFGSEYNQKYLFLNGYPEDPNPPLRHYSIVDLVNSGSVWPQMFPGINHYDFNASHYTWLNWSYLPSYWGI